MKTSKTNITRLARLAIQDIKIKLIIGLIIAVLVVGLVAWLLNSSSVTLSSNDKIEVTPVQIEQIKSIGQWEFLSISDEEMIDTVRHGFFGDDELTRIYYGTLRLGIDLNDTEEKWITMDNDTVNVILPPIKLLDENFLDEAKTRTFYEEGQWKEADKAAMTRRAIIKMRQRCLVKSNIESAERNALAQFNQLMESMGFKFVRIRFHSPKS